MQEWGRSLRDCGCRGSEREAVQGAGAALCLALPGLRACVNLDLSAHVQSAPLSDLTSVDL